MASELFTAEELDAHLDVLAQDQEGFEVECERLAARLDREKRDLAIADPSTWKRDPGSMPTSADPFRVEVESIQTLDREREAQLARRIEFARVRLRLAREAAGLEPGEVLDGVGQLAQQWMSTEGEPKRRSSADKVMVRAAELHALRSELVERNLYLVLINVERYVHGGGLRYDLIQEGSSALFRAVDGFDWRRGLLFRTYAVHWLNQAFRNYLYNHSSTVRVPVYLQKALKQINQAQIRLGDPNASAAQIAEQTDLSEHIVTAALAAARSSYSIDVEYGSDDGDGNRLRDLLEQQDGDEEDGPYTTRLEDITLEEGLGNALSTLSDRERLVVTKRFGLQGEREHTLSEVAQQLGVSVERVRQIQVRALGKLDTPGLRRDLDPFLN